MTKPPRGRPGKSSQARGAPRSQWDMGLGPLVCQIRRPGPKWGFSKMFSQASPYWRRQDTCLPETLGTEPKAAVLRAAGQAQTAELEWRAVNSGLAVY